MISGRNLLLDFISNEQHNDFISRFEYVDMPVRTVLFEAEETPRYVHFLTSGMASIVTPMEGGEAVEVGLTGHEGFAEKMHVLGPQRGFVTGFMQIAGSALRMKYPQFRAELLANTRLLEGVLRYVQQDGFVLA